MFNPINHWIKNWQDLRALKIFKIIKLKAKSTKKIFLKTLIIKLNAITNKTSRLKDLLLKWVKWIRSNLKDFLKLISRNISSQKEIGVFHAQNALKDKTGYSSTSTLLISQLIITLITINLMLMPNLLYSILIMKSLKLDNLTKCLETLLLLIKQFTHLIK